MRWTSIERFAYALVAAALAACATLPGKEEIVIGKEKFGYALRGSGGPAVVLEAGLGGGMDTWSAVYEGIAAYTTVFAYDRRGYGDSGQPADARTSVDRTDVATALGEAVLDVVAPGASAVITAGRMTSRTSDEVAPRSGATVVAELRELLARAGVAPPYVLVGHSLGGLYTSLYARTYPQEVAGLVWLDSMHPDQIERCKEYLPVDECDPEHYPWWVRTLIDMAPGVIRAEMTGATETGRQIHAAGPLPPVPLVVISQAGNPQGSATDRMWAALQEDLAAQSPQGRRIVAQRAGHAIQADAPELVIGVIEDLIEQARRGGADSR